MVQLLLLDEVSAAEWESLSAQIVALSMLPGQDVFVAMPEQLLRAAAADVERNIFAIRVGEEVVGTGTLHQGGALSALGWAGNWILLRGLLIGANCQGQGYGAAAAAAAVGLAQRLYPQAVGVVLGVNEANIAGQRAYRKAGYDVVGRCPGGRGGPQLILSRSFSSIKVDDLCVVN